MKMTDEMLFDEVKDNQSPLELGPYEMVFGELREHTREPLTIGPETYNPVIPSQENVMKYQLKK